MTSETAFSWIIELLSLSLAIALAYVWGYSAGRSREREHWLILCRIIDRLNQSKETQGNLTH